MNKPQINVCIMLMLASLVVGIAAGMLLASGSMHASAIKNECAHYDPRTGEFKWGSLQ